MKSVITIRFIMGVLVVFCAAAGTMAWQGPVGGTGGEEFSTFWDTTPAPYPEFPYNRRILTIIVRAGDWIDAIKVEYKDRFGKTYLSPRFGGGGGTKHRVILSEGDYITGITGTHDGRYITWLCIYFKKRSPVSYGKGGWGDHQFDFWAPKGTAIMDITGRSGRYLDAIGVRYQNLVTESDPGRVYDCNGKYVDEKTAFNWKGDGVCDDGSWGIDMDCWIFDFDGRDCR